VKLTTLTVDKFTEEVAGDSPAPGGGSVAALAGALGAALCSMVAHLTLGKEKYQEVFPEMRQMEGSSHTFTYKLLELVDSDTEAYEVVMRAFKMPRDSEADKRLRSETIQSANKHAASVPMETLRALRKAVDFAEMAIKKGNENCISDAGVGVQLIRAAAMGAAYNIRINLLSITDDKFSSEIKKEMTGLLGDIISAVEKLEIIVEERLSV
jgi:formiminotetrahydrofolate cyclodeaminase